MRIAMRLISALTILTVPCGDIVAQAVVEGVVVEGRAKPVVGADVVIEALGLSTKSDERGRFSLAAPAGRQVLTTRAIGYRPTIVVLELREANPTDIELELEPIPKAPYQLDSLVTTVAPVPHLSAHMRAFEERRATGFGRFVTSEQLRVKESAALSDVLRMTGLPTIRRPWQCGGGIAVATGRGFGYVKRPAWMRCAGQIMVWFQDACYMSIYLDGMRIWAPGQLEPPNIDNLKVHALEAVEVYKGASQLPTQYTGTDNSCGAVLLWSREK